MSLQPAPTGGTPGICNANLPNSSVYNRFLYVVKVHCSCSASMATCSMLGISADPTFISCVQSTTRNAWHSSPCWRWGKCVIESALTYDTCEQVLVDNGFYVLIDNHLNTDSTATDNPTGWVTYWANLMKAIAAMGPIYQNSVMADILNEPDSRGLS